ncbi:MAG TPA: hypothetical protein VFQ25_00920 [Ktedonobacterales bacterium]|nr:hypothetical protein [Ktedonobacterales bacterium]
MDESATPKPERPRASRVRRARRFARREWRLLLAWLALACAMACVALAVFAQVASSYPPEDYGAYASFKIAMWRVSPDSMTYTETDDAGHLLFTYTTSKPDLVNRWFAYVNDETPVGKYTLCGYTLNEPPPIHHTYVFSRHGAPVETATSGTQSYLCYFYTLSAGSSRDPFQYFLSNPHASPDPPPVGHQEIP